MDLQVNVEVGCEMDALEDLVVEHGKDGYSYYLLAAAEVLKSYAYDIDDEKSLEVFLAMVDSYLEMTEPEEGGNFH